MKVEFINPFITSAEQVLSVLIGGGIEIGHLTARSGMVTTQPISVAMSVSGAIRGQAIYGMSQVTATKIASAISRNRQLAFDEMVVNAINEFGNLLSRRTAILFTENGIAGELSPPTVVRGVGIEIAEQASTLVIPVYTKCGKIEINLALAEAQ